MTSLKKKNNNENLLKAISFLRLDLTLEELGDKLGYKKSTVSKYINGKLSPSTDFLQKFQEVFKIDIDNLKNEQIETKNPTPENNSEGLKDKVISLLEKSLKRVESELELALQENERLKHN